MARSVRELVVWQKAMRLAETAHTIVGHLLAAERYRLGDQIARAAVSVPANIEGCGRGAKRDYARFLSIARGSLAELETLLLLSSRLSCASVPELRRALGSDCRGRQDVIRPPTPSPARFEAPSTDVTGPLLTVNYPLLTICSCPPASVNGPHAYGHAND